MSNDVKRKSLPLHKGALIASKPYVSYKIDNRKKILKKLYTFYKKYGILYIRIYIWL